MSSNKALPMESVASVALAAESHGEGGGLEFPRNFAREGVSPYDAIEWETRTASITNEKGEVLFIQEGVEIPKGWSQTAANIVVSKYFHGQIGTPQRELSVRQLVERVVRTLTEWGVQGGYFSSAADSQAFHDDLAFLLLNQYASFNSPVWFNCGIEPNPQCSACFINSVEDTMDSILELARTEGRLFKYGSGTGTNFSPLRSSRAKLSGGGIASGPVSFMKGFDAFAGVIKSGGKTRRAAKMVILNIDHPDIVEFIECKSKEEKKAWTLMEAGYDGSVDGEAYGSIFFQNANNSVRVTDEFMKEVEQYGTWSTRERPSGQIVDTYPARDLMRKIAESCHICGDPGMQYDSTINRWHTCKSTARINASNPCSEYMFLDDSACNLASFNLLKFVNAQGDFDVNGFRKAVDVMITAQEIIIDNASYPTEKIGKNSRDYRPLGLGYANLGALLMYNGLAYDSDEGRDFAAAITAVMTGEAYLQSARISAKLGPFAGYAMNRESFLEVMRMHRSALQSINPNCVPADLMQAAQECWDLAVLEGTVHGFRNAQTTVLAPTGTIGFMMDCDTTGVEPDLALVKFKKMVGGGMMKIVNNTVPAALAKLGYSEEEIKAITKHIDENGTIEGAPVREGRHLPAFDCAFKPQRGTRSHPLHGPHQDDERRAAVHFRRYLQDRQCPREHHGRSDHRFVHAGLAAGSESDRHLPGQLQTDAAAERVPRAKSEGAGSPGIGNHRIQAGAAQASCRAQGDDPQVQHRRARRLYHGGHVRRRAAGRDFPGDGQGRKRYLRLDGLFRHGHFSCAPIRRSAEGSDRQVLPCPLRAFRTYRESGSSICQIHRRLYLPLAGVQIPVNRRTAADRRSCAGKSERAGIRRHSAQCRDETAD